MLQQTITIINKLGMHTRAAAKLVATAMPFRSEIILKRNNQNFDCKKIMELISCGGTKGMSFELIVTGEDESEAFRTIVELINNRFGESK